MRLNVHRSLSYFSSPCAAVSLRLFINAHAIARLSRSVLVGGWSAASPLPVRPPARPCRPERRLQPSPDIGGSDTTASSGRGSLRPDRRARAQAAETAAEPEPPADQPEQQPDDRPGPSGLQSGRPDDRPGPSGLPSGFLGGQESDSDDSESYGGVSCPRPCGRGVSRGEETPSTAAGWPRSSETGETMRALTESGRRSVNTAVTG